MNDLNFSVFFFSVLKEEFIEKAINFFLFSQGGKKKKTTKITDTSPCLEVTSPTAHELSVAMFVLKEKTRNHDRSCVCFFSLPQPPLCNPCVIWGKFSFTYKDNCKIFMWTDILKPDCPLVFYNLVRNILHLVFQVKPKQGHKWDSRVRWWAHHPEEMTWPTGFPSQVTGNCGLASRGDQKAEVFLPFLHPFMCYGTYAPVWDWALLFGTVCMTVIEVPQ